MKFPEVQQRLRDEGYNPYAVYSGVYDDLAEEPSPKRGCPGTWSLLEIDGCYVVTVRDLFRPDRFPRDTNGPEPVAFVTEDDACDYLWERATALNEPGTVRPIAPAELPGPVIDWIRDCGWWPPASYAGNPFVATRSGSSLRIASVRDTFELHRHDHSVPGPNAPMFAADNLDDVCRVLMTELGDRTHRPLGWPLVAFNFARASTASKRALFASDLHDISAAYRVERGEPLLTVVAEGVRLDLVSTRLVDEAVAIRLPLVAYGDGRAAVFHGGYTSDGFEVREQDESPRYRLGWVEERSHVYDLVLESDALSEIHEELARIFAERRQWNDQRRKSSAQSAERPGASTRTNDGSP